MCRRLVCFLGLFLVGCASAQAFHARANPDVDPFACTTRELAARDFTVTTAERDAGLIIAERRDHETATLFTGSETYKVLTFNLLDDGTIRVQAKRETREGSSRRTIAIQDADDLAQEILRACGTLEADT